MGALKLDPLKIVLLVSCLVINRTSAQNQLSVDKDDSKIHYRDGNLESSLEFEPLEERIVLPAVSAISFTTFTRRALVRGSFLTITGVRVTTTLTSTLTSTTTCTTSTAPLTTCSISGRRRRNLESDEFLSNENEENRDDDDGPFLSPAITHKEYYPVQSGIEVDREKREVPESHPLAIEPSWLNDRSLQDGLALLRATISTPTATQTLTKYLTTIYTVSLTAVCSSTSGFPICAGPNGK